MKFHQSFMVITKPTDNRWPGANVSRADDEFGKSVVVTLIDMTVIQ